MITIGIIIGLVAGYIAGATAQAGRSASQMQRYYSLAMTRDRIVEQDQRAKLVYIRGSAP